VIGALHRTTNLDSAAYDRQSWKGRSTPPRAGEYRLLSSRTDRIAPFEWKLASFGVTTGPWTSRGWDPPNASALEAARDALGILRELNLVPDTVVATAKGGIGICFSRGGLFGSIEFLNSGDVVLLKLGAGSLTAVPVEPSPLGIRDGFVDLRQFFNC
jgi:hypothetical protein